MKKRVEATKENVKNSILEFIDAPERGVKVFCAPMGGYKTTSIKEIAAERFNRKTNEGCIIVVERIKDGVRIKKEINKLAKDKICFVLRGFNPKKCRQIKYSSDSDIQITDEEAVRTSSYSWCYRCGEQKCPMHPDKYKRAKEYPVLIIMHKRLSSCLYNNLDGLHNFSSWDGGKRDVMFIDEKPSLVDDRFVTKVSLKEIMGDWKLRRLRIVKDINKWAKAELTSKGELIMSASSRGKKDVHFKINNEHYLKILEKLYNEGGLIDRREFTDKLTKRREKVGYALCRAKHYGLDKLYIKKIAILDGTADIDPYYDLFKYDVQKFYREEQICRLHVLKNRRHKNALINKTDISQIKNELESTHKKHPKKKILIVTNKDFKKKIKALGLDYVVLRHYMALKGRNDLIKRSVVYFTHIFQKPLSCYKSLAMAKGLKIESYDTTNRRNNFGFEDNTLEVIRVRDIITNLVQDIYRTRIRENKKPVDVYIGLNDGLAINVLQTYYTNFTFIRENF